MYPTISEQYVDLEACYFDFIKEGWSKSEALDQVLAFIAEIGVVTPVEDMEFLK
jgi:hypothetical protein